MQPSRSREIRPTRIASTFRAWVLVGPLALVVEGGCAPDLPKLDDTGSSGTDSDTGTSDTGTSDTGTSDTGTSDTGTSDTGTSDTGTNECGNGIVDAGEICDATELDGDTCEGFGYGGGELACDTGCGAYDTSGCTPAMPVLSLSFSQVKLFDFSWGAVQGAEYYQVLESPALGEPFEQLGGDIFRESVSFEMPLHLRWQASYVLRACNAAGCKDSAVVDVVGSLAEAVGYFKASNTDETDAFGGSVAVSTDGNTLAVGARFEDSNATGIGGSQINEGSPNSGAVYVFVRDGMGEWSQQAYVKASNTDLDDRFGRSIALSGDGGTLAVGATGEDSNAIGIDGNQLNEGALDSGAVYVFVRDGMGEWSQQAYVKASNTYPDDQFGTAVSVSADGNTLAIGSLFESSIATGINGEQNDHSAYGAGAVYMFVRNGAGDWSQQAYVKASNTNGFDYFGASVALSDDGDTLAVGAVGEDSLATGIDGDHFDNSGIATGAVYVFVRSPMQVWSQQVYVKASNTGSADLFGTGVALTADGDILAVSAPYEDGAANADGYSDDNSVPDAGAIYVFARGALGHWDHTAYIKAPFTDSSDLFGASVTLTDDGNALVVGATGEDSDSFGLGGDQANNSILDPGATYVLTRDAMGVWMQQAYVKAPNTEPGDVSGSWLALSGDGGTLAIGAVGEDSNATGVGGDQAANSTPDAGVVYLY